MFKRIVIMSLAAILSIAFILAACNDKEGEGIGTESSVGSETVSSVQ